MKISYDAHLVNFESLKETILGEGKTPLIESRSISQQFGFSSLYLKNEMVNPTGSFKDRESAYVFSRLLSPWTSKKIAIASSGNAAISACAYSAYFGKTCLCYVSDKIPQGKIDLITLLGGQIKKIPGSYEDVYEYLIDNLPENAINITSGQLDSRENGNIPIVEEIYASGIKPEAIIIPVGNGSLLYGIFKGLQKLMMNGIIKSYPQLIGVEMLGYAPVAEAIRQGKAWVAIAESPDSIADAGIAAQKAYCSAEAIFALKETKGFMVEIHEEDLQGALKAILKEGLVAEPSSACVVAALKYLPDFKEKTLVAILSGSGFKMIPFILNQI
ncbi:MAG: pyridoxal-phosphate dependent enzyme [Candidatus Gracilibacteria bacterium]|jgi:threonine synthase